jgi:hypothetical protein
MISIFVKKSFMIQRIQSLYLLAVITSSFFLIFKPIAYYTLSDASIVTFKSSGFYNNSEPASMLSPAYPMLGLVIISILMSFIAILTFKKRRLQMQLCIYNTILTLLLGSLIFIYYFILSVNIMEGNNLQVISKSLFYPILIPLVNVILLYQAFRYIKKDDQLIKSYDRLRD